MSSRRRFLAQAPAGLIGATALASAQTPSTPTPPATPGAPPTFGTAPAVGPEVTTATFAEAEKLMRITLKDADRAMAAASWRSTMPGLMDRRDGPRKLAIPETVAPATVWNPAMGRTALGPARNRFARSAGPVPPLPAKDEDIAFAPVTLLSRWVESRALSSVRLTRIYLDRIRRLDGRLRSVITLTADQALAQAAQADREIAAGRYRGPLHGLPYGLKDLLDTAGVRTTYGAEPYRDRVPAKDAAVVQRLQAAGAVMLAKLSLGALAMNDIWFGGQTMNPWLPEEGASGSSAGPGAATAAGLVAFSIGSETGGSIVSPSMRCGVTGLRPTFGRVPRTGAMTLCWSLDKLGPMTRTVEDAMLVLQAISGTDAGDAGSVPAKLAFDARASVKGLRVGYVPAWMDEAPAIDVDRQALALLKQLGMQGPDCWPNFFRQARFLSAVDFVQADRLRRMVAQEMARIMGEVDLLLVPSLREEMLTITNHTGHPSLTLRTGFTAVGEARSDWAPDPARPVPTFSPPRRVPHGVTLIGRLFEEGVMAQAGLALERAAGVAGERPPGF